MQYSLRLLGLFYPNCGENACCGRNRYGTGRSCIDWGEKEATVMEQNLRTPEPYDYRQYDRIW